MTPDEEKALQEIAEIRRKYDDKLRLNEREIQKAIMLILVGIALWMILSL